MRYQCVHPSVKISNATSESAIWRKFLWLACIERPYRARSSAASYRSLEFALLFSIYTISLRPWKVWIRTASLVSGFAASVQGKKSRRVRLWLNRRIVKDELWRTILSILRLFLFFDFYTILRFFRLYDSSDFYSPIFPILRVLRDSPIIPIIRFFRFFRFSELYAIFQFFWLSDFSDFSDSPSSTRFSYFSEYTIFRILRVLRHSPICLIIRFFRFFSDSPSSTRYDSSDFSVVAKVNDPLMDHCRKCPSQPSSGKIFWKLLTVKQQTGIQDLTTVHLV